MCAASCAHTHRYSSTDQCPAGQVLIGRCDGNQIYDTSSCVPCNPQCISAAKDPQGKGQYIERVCWFNELDYRCRPCTGRCPVGSYITAQCSGKGRTDTGCTFCKSFCQEGLIGVYQKHGQYISGRCDGTTFADEQVRAFISCSNTSLSSLFGLGGTGLYVRGVRGRIRLGRLVVLVELVGVVVCSRLMRLAVGVELVGVVVLVGLAFHPCVVFCRDSMHPPSLCTQ